MKNIIIRFVCSVLVFIWVIFIIIYFYEKNIYTITYNTYEYNPTKQKQIIKKNDCKFTLTGYSETEVIEYLNEIEYLNDLCVGDSISILKIEKK